MTPEETARLEIDAQLIASGWVVQAKGIINLATFRDRAFTDLFPGRTLLPKTLIFAKDDSHAEDIVHLCREVFGAGNDFCKTITYQAKHPATGKPVKGRDLIKEFCNAAEMTSRSYLADFWLDGDNQVRMLGYSYHSKPLPSVAERSQQHDGTIVFELVGEPVEKLKGTYWTERKTTGEVVLKFRESARLDEFPADLGKHSVSGKQ